VLIRNERVAADTDLSDGLDRTYSIKVWGIEQAEPADWAIQHTMVDQEPLGSFYLNAHYVDVTFGDLTVTPLPGAELLLAQDDLSDLLPAGREPAAAAAASASSGSAGGASEPAAALASLSSLVAAGDEAAAAA